MFMKVHHWTLFCTRWIQFICWDCISLGPTVLLFSHLSRNLLNYLSLEVIHRKYCTLLFLSLHATCPVHLSLVQQCIKIEENRASAAMKELILKCPASSPPEECHSVYNKNQPDSPHAARLVFQAQNLETNPVQHANHASLHPLVLHSTKIQLERKTKILQMLLYEYGCR
jgi:hypothetical protein